jgi:hypothetical protein
VFVLDYHSLDLQISKEPENSHNLYIASILENGDIKATRNFEFRQDLKLHQMLKEIEEKAVKIKEKAVIPQPQPDETIHK